MQFTCHIPNHVRVVLLHALGCGKVHAVNPFCFNSKISRGDRVIITVQSEVPRSALCARRGNLDNADCCCVCVGEAKPSLPRGTHSAGSEKLEAKIFLSVCTRSQHKMTAQHVRSLLSRHASVFRQQTALTVKCVIPKMSGATPKPV